MKIDLKKAYDK